MRNTCREASAGFNITSCLKLPYEITGGCAVMENSSVTEQGNECHHIDADYCFL